MIEQLIRTYSAGETVFAQGDAVDVVLHVLNGRLQATQSAGDNATYESGELLGATALLTQQGQRETVTCETPVQVEVFDAASIARMLRTEPERMGPIVASVFDHVAGRCANGNAPPPANTANGPVGRPTTHATGVATTARLVVMPITPRARVALGAEQAVLTTFPCVIGRNGEANASAPEGRLTLVDSKPFFISRDHLLIDREDDHFVLTDNKSSLGTIVNGLLIGKQADADSTRLHDPVSRIILGGTHSPYEFELRAES
jgi:hypothetical protein